VTTAIGLEPGTIAATADATATAITLTTATFAILDQERHPLIGLRIERSVKNRGTKTRGSRPFRSTTARARSRSNSAVVIAAGRRTTMPQIGASGIDLAQSAFARSVRPVGCLIRSRLR
jgi:hypothetical protein